MINSYYNEYNHCNRLIEKDGHLGRSLNKRVISKNRRYSSYFQHLHSIIISNNWAFVVFLISMAHLGSWTIFALLWYLVSLRHGDFTYQDVKNSVNVSVPKKPCLLNVESNFLAFFLFSIETQATIGYGYYQPSNECIVSAVLLALQATIGVLISIFSAGIVLNKLVRPTNYESMITFSYHAVVSHRDGKPCFMICICNPHKILVTNTHISLLFIQLKGDLQFNSKSKQKPIGQTYNSTDIINCYDLQLTNTAFQTGAVFLCPTIIEHVIDRNSPLYPYLFLLENDLNHKCTRCLALDQYFEIVITVEGIIEATGNPCHYRTSYTPGEIFWNYRFRKVSCEINEDGYITFNADELGMVEPVHKK